MKHPHTHIHRTLLAVLALLAIGLSAACGSPDEGLSGHDDHTGVPGPETVTPEQVSERWLSTVYSWRPVTDSSPTDALVRGRDLATGVLAEPNPPRVSLANPAWPQWDSWRAGKDIITARVSAVSTQPIGSHTAQVSALVEQTVLHTDGESTPLQTLEVTVTVLQLESGLWRVSDYRSVPATPDEEGEH
ncbi:MAG: hypothetical protein WAW85_16840 [Gordonia sp. (in: high G+C Gram-positive bacteria)]|uniref:hypothetical protein n=1 Tax=Gordonia sp. (in: high G+C Gram-positive bacteria) TaxID=84139 RepID=UPI003BB4C459